MLTYEIEVVQGGRCLNEEPMSLEQMELVQPHDLIGPKKQLVQLLLVQSGGSLRVNRLRAEYYKVFGQPFILAKYNDVRLIHLLKKMTDALVIKGDGSSCTLHLKSKIGDSYIMYDINEAPNPKYRCAISLCLSNFMSQK